MPNATSRAELRCRRAGEDDRLAECEPANTARKDSAEDRGPISETGGEVEMVSADKPVNITFTVTAKERYLWTPELRRRGCTAVSVPRERMNELIEGN